MRQSMRRTAVLVLVVGLVLLATTGELLAQKDKETITGVVKRAEVRGTKVRAVYLEDSNGGEYLIVRGTEVGKELLGQVGATLKATGYVRKSVRDKDFERTLDVLEYDVVSPAPAAENDASTNPVKSKKSGN